MTDRSVTLYCTEGGSDKLYKAEVASSGEGWAVNFWFGPRTGTLQSGTKTKSPVSKGEAIALWEKLVREKKAKGYHEGADAPAYTEVDGTSKDTGLRPMLLTPATEDDLPRFVGDGAWAAQPKLNGKRILLKIEGGRAISANRRGLECPIPKDLRSTCVAIGSAILDGELVGPDYHAFDCLSSGSDDHRGEALSRRLAALEEALRGSGGGCLKRVLTAIGQKEKALLVASQAALRQEGVVFKRLDGAYEPGRIETLGKAIAVKVKFYASAEFVVTGWNANRQSIALGACDATGAIVAVGNVAVPAKYAGEIQVGGVVQVRYLYATPGHQLYQPTLDASSGSVRRTDKKPAECLLSQLKYEGRDE